VDIDRQAIEKRDFPIGRRGYDPAAVDAHLRALAAEVEELQRVSAGGGGEPSLALTAGTQVQSILQAAETAAADIERLALDDARSAREEADRDAERTREEAIGRARAHVAAVAQATSVLLERVSSMDGEVSALIESLRAGASRLAGDLAAVEKNMGELYDASSGRVGSPEDREGSSAAVQIEFVEAIIGVPQEQGPPESPVAPPPTALPSQAVPAQPTRRVTSSAQAAAETATPGDGDLDSARLVALNMALNGESRADADRYLAENFQLADREKLVEEVYAAIEG
jgi:DivIVA domain-containing protein